LRCSALVAAFRAARRG